MIKVKRSIFLPHHISYYHISYFLHSGEQLSRKDNEQHAKTCLFSDTTRGEAKNLV